jgi:hypothetical protein
LAAANLREEVDVDDEEEKDARIRIDGTPPALCGRILIRVFVLDF